MKISPFLCLALWSVTGFLGLPTNILHILSRVMTLMKPISSKHFSSQDERHTEGGLEIKTS